MILISLFLLQTLRCKTPKCRADLSDAGGHSHCRSHSLCSYWLDDGVVWSPYECSVCYGRWRTMNADEVSVLLFQWCPLFNINMDDIFIFLLHILNP